MIQELLIKLESKVSNPDSQQSGLLNQSSKIRIKQRDIGVKYKKRGKIYREKYQQLKKISKFAQK